MNTFAANSLINKTGRRSNKQQKQFVDEINTLLLMNMRNSSSVVGNSNNNANNNSNNNNINIISNSKPMSNITPRASLPESKSHGISQKKNKDSCISKDKNEDNEKVKHPPSAFLLFCKDTRDCVRERCPGLSPVDVTRLLSQLWKSLEVSKKQSYIQKRHELIEKFKIEHPNYNGETTAVKKCKVVKKKLKINQFHKLFTKSEDNGIDSIANSNGLPSNSTLLNNNTSNFFSDSNFNGYAFQNDKGLRFDGFQRETTSASNFAYSNPNQLRVNPINNNIFSMTQTSDQAIIAEGLALGIKQSFQQNSPIALQNQTTNIIIATPNINSSSDYPLLNPSHLYSPTKKGDTDLNDFLSHFPKPNK